MTKAKAPVIETTLDFPYVGEPLADTRHEHFCLWLIKGENRKTAVQKAGYTTNLSHQASMLLRRPDVKARLTELQTAADNAMIANVTERKQVLTKIIRNEESPKYQISATAELNKMDHVYEAGAAVHVDNRKVEINVISPEARELTERILQGARTEAQHN